MPGSKPAENLLSNLIVCPEVPVIRVPVPPEKLFKVATVEFVTDAIVAVCAVFPERKTTSPADMSVVKFVPLPVRVEVEVPEFPVVPVIPWCVANCKLKGVIV